MKLLGEREGGDTLAAMVCQLQLGLRAHILVIRSTANVTCTLNVVSEQRSSKQIFMISAFSLYLSSP